MTPGFTLHTGNSQPIETLSENIVDSPVAWALFSKEIMPTGIAYAVRRVEIELAQVKADLDIQDGEIRPLYLKNMPTDKLTSLERERLQTLERICAGVTQDAIDGGWTVIGIMNYAKGLERKIKSMVDENVDKVLAMSDKQVTALTVMDGHNPDDVAKISRHAAETAILKSKINSLEYQIKQLSSIHSATVNALADERRKP